MEQNKTRFYLIRHGETDWNKGGRYQGCTNIQLNDAGREQARLLGERFKFLPLDVVYVSPLDRAVATAAPLAAAHGLTPIQDAHFREINFGEWEGMTSEEISAKYGKEFDEFLKNPEEMPFSGEGSFKNVEKRIAKGFEKILEGKNGKSIAVVTHGGIIRIAVKYLLGIEGQWFNKTWIDNTSITLVEIHKNYNLLRVLNDSSHINKGIF